MPSAMSNSTTSPSSLRPIRWASVPPIWPAPINAILGRAMREKNLGSGTAGAGEIGHRPFSPCRSSRPPQHATPAPRSPHPITSPPTHPSTPARRHGPGRAVKRGSLRAHLNKARGGALELAGLETVGRAVEGVGLGFRGSNELHRVVVKRVYQDNESLCLVAPVVIHDRDMIEHDSVVLTCDL